MIEADAIKNRDAMYKHLSSSDFTRNDPMLSSYVHEYSTKAAEMLLAAAGASPFSCSMQSFAYHTCTVCKILGRPHITATYKISLWTHDSVCGDVALCPNSTWLAEGH